MPDTKSITELEITKEPPLENTLPWPNYPNKKKTDYGVLEANTLMNYDIRRYETTIDEIVKEGDQMVGVYIKKVKFVNDGGRVKLQDVEGTREYLPCDYLIIAMGFIGTTTDDLNNYKLDSFNNRVKLNNFKYNDKISVCGDMKNGQSLVVIALKDGIDCAEQIINKYNK